MRNDALDELEVVPSLTTDARDRADFGYAAKPEPAQRAAAAGSKPAAPAKKASTAPLWALLVAVLIAFGSLAWWSSRQIALLNQQLVATQLSFAQISEEAAGRIKDISGKVVATESTATTETESLKLRVRQLENQLAELGKQQQSVQSQQSGQAKQLSGVVADLQSQQAAQKLSADKLQTLATAQEQLQAAQASLAAVDARSKAQAADIETLKQQVKGITRLEQDLLVLSSQLDNQAAKGNNTAEFDAFRAQMTRSLSTLQSQIQTLQQQISGKQ